LSGTRRSSTKQGSIKARTSPVQIASFNRYDARASVGTMMRRRDFLTILGAAAVASPLGANAQQPPVIGFLRPTKPEESGHLVAAVREGLRESSYDKVLIEARWGNGSEEQLPNFARELIDLPVAAMVAGSVPSARAAKAATTTIPIVFVTGSDPQTEGLVDSISRPGGNVTGVSFYDIPVTGKRLALLHELVPKAEIIAVLQDPTSATYKSEILEIEKSASALRQKIITVQASNEREINVAFLAVAKSGAGAILIGGGANFNGRRNQFIGLAALHAIPASYAFSGTVAAGGLVSYGANQTDAYRRAGVYSARILKGEKPGDLPVELPTKFDLAINLKTAKALGLAVPPELIARAEEVIQ
jgi:putative tryptophan/tyrosine transport system substrate-binding protein